MPYCEPCFFNHDCSRLTHQGTVDNAQQETNATAARSGHFDVTVPQNHIAEVQPATVMPEGTPDMYVERWARRQWLTACTNRDCGITFELDTVRCVHCLHWFCMECFRMHMADIETCKQLYDTKLNDFTGESHQQDDQHSLLQVHWRSKPVDIYNDSCQPLGNLSPPPHPGLGQSSSFSWPAECGMQDSCSSSGRICMVMKIT